MKPYEFRTAWTAIENNLRPVSLQTLNKFNLAQETSDFLCVSGLPQAAAPFLTFVGDDDTGDKYDTIDLLPDWFHFLEPEYNKYVVIGSDGSGDIIALNTRKGCIVEWLDHEDYFSSRFMNASIGQLANCILIYRDFLKTINTGKTSEECFDRMFSDAQFDALYDILESIDKRAVNEGFWKEELDLLLADREDARK